MKSIILCFWIMCVFETKACMCDTIKSVANEVVSHKLVVKGVVLSVDPLISPDEVRYTKGAVITQEIGFLIRIKVTQQFKGGMVEDTINIITGTGNSSGDCGFTFLKGNEYIIFASDTVVTSLEKSFVTRKRVKRKQLSREVQGYYTHICTRTQIANFKEELEIQKALGITAANIVLAKAGANTQGIQILSDARLRQYLPVRRHLIERFN